MPPRKYKKVISLASPGPSTQGLMGQKIVEEVTASGDEFEHLNVEAEERYPFKLIFLHYFSGLCHFFKTVLMRM